MADVEIVVRNIVEGEEEIAKLDTAYGDLDKTVKKSEGSFLDINPAIRKNKQDMQALFDMLPKGTKVSKELEQELKGFAKTNDMAAKSASGFTGKLNQLAKGLIGVATAYSLGRAATNFIKDSIEAARAAGMAAKGFDAMEKASKDLKTSLGAELIAVADPVIGGFAKDQQTTADFLRVTRVMNELLESGAIDLFEYNENQIQVFESGEKLAESMEFVNAKLEEQEGLLGNANVAFSGYVDSFWRMANIEGMDKLPLVMARIAREQASLNSELAELGEKMTPLSKGIEGFEKSITDLRKEEEKLALIEFRTPEQETQLAEIREDIDSVTAAWDRQTSMMIFGLAKQQFALDGFTGVEVAGLVELAGGLGLIDPAQVALWEAIAQASNDFDATGNTAAFAQTVHDIAAGLSDLDGTTVRIFFDYNATGDVPGGPPPVIIPPDGGPPDEGGGEERRKGGKIESAHGGSFIVPPGFNNDDFTAGFSSGEEVNVSTSQQQFDNSRSHTGNNNFFGVDTADVFEALEDASFLS